MMFLAFLIILVEKSEESEVKGKWRDYSLWFFYSFQPSFVLSGCVTEPDKHGKCEHTFNSWPIKVGHGNSADSKLFELPQKVES